MSKKSETGQAAEDLARVFLSEKGYTILAVNWRHYHKELDIVARQGNRLVIVEVKSTIESNYSNPSDLLSSVRCGILWMRRRLIFLSTI